MQIGLWRDTTASCWRSARFPSRKPRRARMRRTSVPRRRTMNRNMATRYYKTVAGGRQPGYKFCSLPEFWRTIGCVGGGNHFKLCAAFAKMARHPTMPWTRASRWKQSNGVSSPGRNSIAWRVALWSCLRSCAIFSLLADHLLPWLPSFRWGNC